MGKLSELDLAIKDLRTAATAINNAADALAELFSDTPHRGDTLTPRVPEEPVLTFEQVRAILSDRSRQGFTAQIRTLLQKYGGTKLSQIDASNYRALVADVEVLGNG